VGGCELVLVDIVHVVPLNVSVVAALPPLIIPPYTIAEVFVPPPPPKDLPVLRSSAARVHVPAPTAPAGEPVLSTSIP
tara:strand:- start:280 stop:513 length:234 start_codon:yes stop_codon:yes gene_type:complete